MDVSISGCCDGFLFDAPARGSSGSRQLNDRLADLVDERLGRAAMLGGTGVALVAGLGALLAIAATGGFGTALVVDRVRK
jgi:hypothetical protein